MPDNHSPQILITDNSPENSEHIISMAEQKVILVQRRFIHIKRRARAANSYSSLSISESLVATSGLNVNLLIANLYTLADEEGLTMPPTFP